MQFVLVAAAILCVCALPRLRAQFATGGDRLNGKCERITIPMCMDMKYNMTRMPNLVGHKSQREAEQQVVQFFALVQSGCSPLLNFFLCSMFAPMCTEQVDEILVIPACRSMCLEVKSKCEPVLHNFNFKWPNVLDCNKLPERSDKRHLCMEVPSHGVGREVGRFGGAIPGGFTQNSEWMRQVLQVLRGKTSTPAVPPFAAASSPLPPHQTCPDRFVHVSELPGNRTCAPRCNIDVYFRHEDKRFAEIWMVVWAALCFVSTSVTVVTFLIDTSRFRYPERPIIFLSMCYAIYSTAYVIRMVIGPNLVSCDRNSRQVEFLIQEGLESTWCIIVFLILYFFGMASSLWWVILTLTWFLAAGRKWGREAIQAMSSYFHLAAWAIPAIKTIIILTMRRVDGDELTGLCYVGGQNRGALLGFVLAPLLAYLLIGTFFILYGFICMFRIRNDLKQDGTNIRKLEKLMAKIGVFSVLYTVPATCVIGCYFYELQNADRWRYTAMSTNCRIIPSGPQAGQLDCSLDKSIPTVEVYMLKLFMSLVVGITSGMWIWSSKTIGSWSEFCARTFTRRRRKSNAPAYGQRLPPGGVVGLGSGCGVSGPNGKRVVYQKCATKPLPPAPAPTIASSHVSKV
ncbi:hypothetical protein LSH36_11g13062 [Paralvinella palmiformis]|uniref:Uncharacterized protein n=1 Tax=Paralvinella palmiformis TaxID=53620 RepID=A0AAD9NI35_9ANNE|nr:hypothetical protein LSH36_11g13062 [Paralvinella palmiformis]